MTRERRALIAILTIVCLSALTVAAASMYVTARNETRRTNAALRGQIQEMELRMRRAEEAETEIPRLEAELASLRERFYTRDEIDVFRLGLLVGRMLDDAGISVERYYTVDGDTPILEFSFSSAPGAVVGFLGAVERRPKEIRIPSFSVRATNGRLDGTVRVTYATVD